MKRFLISFYNAELKLLGFGAIIQETIDATSEKILIEIESHRWLCIYDTEFAAEKCDVKCKICVSTDSIKKVIVEEREVVSNFEEIPQYIEDAEQSSLHA